jgi:hypothetical protein
VAGKTFSLTAVDNTTDGATGLPLIAANDNLTIVGNGDTIERSTVSGTPAFRLIDVASKASLTLENLTLQGGLAFGSGSSAEGGGIYNQGTLDLNGVIVQNNVAQGQGVRFGSDGSGGGLYVVAGNVTLTNVTVSLNTAQGGTGIYFHTWRGSGEYGGGNGAGGGLYVAGGNVTLTSTSLSSNTARGGRSSGTGAGGGLYVAGGTVTLADTNLSSDTAQGAAGSSVIAFNNSFGTVGGTGRGGALYVAGGNVVLTGDSLTANTAEGGIGGYGRYEGAGGSGLGGGVYAAGGTITLRDDSVTGNAAGGGYGYALGLGEGGGLYIDPTAAVYLDAFALANILNNTASTSDPNIHGSYSLLP